MSALIAVMAITVGMYAAVFLAAIYQSRQLEGRFRVGPWTSGLVREVWYNGSPKGHPGIRYYRATIECPNMVDGRARTCLGTGSLGTHGEIASGSRLRIAPLEGTCGDIATAFD